MNVISRWQGWRDTGLWTLCSCVNATHHAQLPSTSTDFFWWPLSSCVCAVGRLSALFKGTSEAAVIKDKVILYFCHPGDPRIWTSFTPNAHRYDSLKSLLPQCSQLIREKLFSVIYAHWKSFCKSLLFFFSFKEKLLKRNTAVYLTSTLNSEPSFSTLLDKLQQVIACERRWRGIKCWWRESNLPMRISQFNWFYYMVY